MDVAMEDCALFVPMYIFQSQDYLLQQTPYFILWEMFSLRLVFPHHSKQIQRLILHYNIQGILYFLNKVLIILHNRSWINLCQDINLLYNLLFLFLLHSWVMNFLYHEYFRVWFTLCLIHIIIRTCGNWL